jgi:diguanylate cyclase (GGDEF)-like protein/PAS domain S-box-containing protein
MNKSPNVHLDETVDGTPEELRAEVARLRGTTRTLEDLVRRRADQLNKALGQIERVTGTLRDSEARFQSLAEQSVAGIAIVEQNRLTYVNACFAETFGYRCEDMLSIPVIETVAHSSRLRITEHMRDCLANGSCPRPLEYEGLKKDGSSVFVELSASRTEMDDRLSVVLVITDITAKRLAENQVVALNHRLGELAVEDPLTGLYNRRFTEASLEREILRAERNHLPLSLVMCDLDHFRSINNAFDRQAGDKVLQAFSSLLKQRCRKSDIACRYGGEEFLLVFPGMPAEVAEKWAETIRAAIAGARVTRDSSSLQVTASFGVATYPQHGHTWQEIIAAADAAQYAAKGSGGNQVRSAAAEAGSRSHSPDLALLLAREG